MMNVGSCGMSRSSFVFILVILILSFGCAKIMIVEENPSYSPKALSLMSVEDKTGVFDLSEEEILTLRNDASLTVREPYILHAFLDDAVVQHNASQAWELQVNNINLTGAQNSVCVLDTGVDTNHPDLADKIVAQHCFCSSSNCCSDGTNESESAEDDHGHGTHVAGIVAAAGGLSGIGVGTKLVVVKMLNSSGGGSEADLINAIEWCVDNSDAQNISAISLSLGTNCKTSSSSCHSTTCSYPSLQEKINAAIVKNISVVIATGNNDNTTHISFPACLPNVTRVASIDKDDSTISNFSNINSLVRLLGVGQDVNSTNMSGGYRIISGTSMATPMISGAISVLTQYLNLSGQSKNTSEVEDILYSSGKIITKNSINYSRIDIYNALLNIDKTSPEISDILPSNNFDFFEPIQNFSATIYDWQSKNITFRLWNATNSVNVTSWDTSESTERVNITINLDYNSNYTYSFEAWDAKNNSILSANYTISAGAFCINLNSPTNNSYTNKNENNFTCSTYVRHDKTLKNVSLFIWNDSDLVYNEPRDISGTSNSSLFNYTFDKEGNYSWGCLAFNNESENSSSENSSIIYDASVPNIANVTSDSITENSFVISWNTTDVANATVYYGVSGDVTNMKESENFSRNHLFTLDNLSSGTAYYYNFTNCDLAGNCNTSTLYNTSTSNIVIANKPNSGGGESDTQTYRASFVDLIEGYNKSLKRGDKISFDMPNGERRTLILKGIADNIVRLIVRNEAVDLDLTEGDSRILKLLGMNDYDLLVHINNVKRSQVEISIRAVEVREVVEDDIEEGTEEDAGENCSNETLEAEDIVEFIEEEEYDDIWIAYWICLGLLVVWALKISFFKKNRIKRSRAERHCGW